MIGFLGKNLGMKKLAFLSDLIFTLFMSGTVTLFLFRYMGVPLSLSLLLSLVCGLLAALSVGALLKAKRKRLTVKKSDAAGTEKLLLHLALLSDEEKTEYLRDSLSTAEEPMKRFGKLRIFTQTQFFFLKFSLTPLSIDEIPNLARLKTGKKKILLCGKIDDDARLLCARLDIEARTGEWLYDRLKQTAALPERYLGDEPVKKRTAKLKLGFSKRNAKRFLVSGGLILLLSRLTPFYYYYLLLGGLLLFVALFVRIFGQA